LVQFSKATAYFLRRGFARQGVCSSEVNGMQGWFGFAELVKALRDQFGERRITIAVAKAIVAFNDGQRFELYIDGDDPDVPAANSRIYIRPAAGHGEILAPNGRFITDANKLYSPSMELKAEDLKVAGKAYHGTHLALYQSIIATGLTPGGNGRSDRMLNHLAHYPAGDARNKAAMRGNSECSIEYDLIGFQGTCVQ